MPSASRRTRDELRAVLLDVGVEILLRQGLVGGAEHVTFSAVFRQAESRWGSAINPASVYKRIWGSQSEFQRDVLMAAAAFYPDGEAQPTMEAAREVIARSDLSTPAARAAALSEVCRVAGEVHIRILESSRPWQIWVGIWALTVSTPTTADDEILGPAIQIGHDKATLALETVLQEVVPAVGYRVLPHYTYEHLALAIGALAEGIALRDRFSDERLRHIERPPAAGDAVVEDAVGDAVVGDAVVGPSGERRTWTLFGVAVEGLVRQFCEPLPAGRSVTGRPKRGKGRGRDTVGA